MFNFKTLLVERNIECPLCGHELQLGDIMFQDDDRGETLCAYCRDEYKKNCILEEGEDGRLLK